MDNATRKLIQNCSKVSTTPSTAMRLVHLVTGEKYSDKQMEHIFEQANQTTEVARRQSRSLTFQG
jgi:hypothetical protein